MLKFHASPTCNELQEKYSFDFSNMDDFDAGMESLEKASNSPNPGISIRLVSWDGMDLYPIDPQDISITYESLEECINTFITIDGLDDMEREVFALLLRKGCTVGDCILTYKDVDLYFGTPAEYAERLHDDRYGEVDSMLYPYIDWDGFGCDLEFDGKVQALENGWLITNWSEF